MGRVISFLSASGGVGKSTLAAMTAAALAPRCRNKLLLIDCGFGVCDAKALLGCDSETSYDLGDLAAGRCEPAGAVDKCRGFLIMPPPSDGSRVPPNEVMHIVAKLLPQCEYILLDCPVSCREESTVYAYDSDLSVICTPADSLSLEKASRLRLGLPRQEGRVRLEITRFDPSAARRGDIKNIDQCIDKVCAQLIGVFPVSPNDRREAAARLAARLDGENPPLIRL